MLSGTSQYALRALLHVARIENGDFVTIKAVASELDIPQNYLSKIFADLARAGVVESARGRAGGYRLAQEPGDISLMRIVSLFDNVEQTRRCPLGRHDCSDASPCLLHDRWKPVVSQFREFLATTTLSDLQRR